MRSDKRDYPPHGLFGGKEGKPSKNILNPGRTQRLLPVLMTEVEKLNTGDVFRHEMAGGGGYGSPWIRNPEHVLKDVVEEKVSIKAAKDDYGVIIIKNDHSLEIDKKGTVDFRRSLEI